MVTDCGGPRFLIKPGVTGLIAHSDRDFISAVNDLITDPVLLDQMRHAARKDALLQSWDTVFEQVFRAYERCRPADSPLRREALGSI